MTASTLAKRVLGIGCILLATSGCAFNGLNSLPLPGAVGRGPGAVVYHIEIANVGTLEQNSPVMTDDVVVGSIRTIRVQAWHAAVDVAVKPGVVIPANAVATVGQTSLLGSMHLELNPPLGQPRRGRLQPGATIPLNRSSTYPSTEQTLSSLSAVLNAGGLGQIGDIIHNFNAALSGREDTVRDLLSRLDRFIGVLDQQRDNLVASIEGVRRLTGTLAEQRDAIAQALRKIPPALDVLIKERPRITAALDKLRVFSDTATRLVNDSKADLVKNLENLEPTVRALADIGPELDAALAYAPIFPYGQGLIDRAVRGDYVNAFFTIDVTNAALKRNTLLGTHWAQPGAEQVPAPGDPMYLQYTYDPLNPAAASPPPGPAAPDGSPPLPGPTVPPTAQPAEASPSPDQAPPVTPHGSGGE